jgi:hypothetical protein
LPAKLLLKANFVLQRGAACSKKASDVFTNLVIVSDYFFAIWYSTEKKGVERPHERRATDRFGVDTC